MSDEHATLAWTVGDHPLAPMPSAFVNAVDDVIDAERLVHLAERQLRQRRDDLNASRRRMHEVMPSEIDNAKVGFRLPDVFTWRRQ